MSSDYGSTWITLPIPIVNLGSYNKAISPSGKYLLYASTLYPINSGYPITHVYKILFIFIIQVIMVPHGEFPYNSLYTTPDSNTSYFSNLTRFKINDSGECIIAMNLNRGNVSQIIHTTFFIHQIMEKICRL
jgi:hypothetical protein